MHQSTGRRCIGGSSGALILEATAWIYRGGGRGERGGRGLSRNPINHDGTVIQDCGNHGRGGCDGVKEICVEDCINRLIFPNYFGEK